MKIFFIKNTCTTSRALLFLGLLFQVLLSTNTFAADASFNGTHFAGSENCAQCHDGLSDNQGNDISIVKNWSSSMMANSTRDPYWQAKVASELHRNPNISDEINDKCTRCHAPMANEGAKKSGATVKLFDDGFLNPNNPYFNHAADGVSCTACHQIMDDGNLGTLEGVSGNYKIQAFSNKTDRKIYGQYTSPLTRPMQNSVEFTPVHGSHMGTSEVCASCHDLKTPFVDAAGNIASTTPESEFPEQMVYTEWKNSAFAVGGEKEKNCQSCHMPKITGSVEIATRGRIDARPNFSKHTFLGANTVMMDILNKNRDELGVTASASDFENGIIDTKKLLKTAASLDILEKEMVGNKLKIVLKVSNNIGHKFPTSYPSRRAFIHFVLRDNAGKIVFESGKLNDNGSIEGVALDKDSLVLEPHYDLITTADQVQVYEPIMENTDAKITHTLMRAKQYKKDNRLLPAGFDKVNAPSDIAVHGAAKADDNFIAGSDTITYLIDVGSQRGFSVSAALNYQTLSYGHLQDLFKDADKVTQVTRFKSMFDQSSLRAELISEANAIVDATENPTNNAVPIAKAISFSVKQGESYAGKLDATDVDNDVLTYQIIKEPKQGILTIKDVKKGDFSYVANATAIGEDSFVFVVNDGKATSNAVAVTITILKESDANTDGNSSGNSNGGGSLSLLLMLSLLLLYLLASDSRKACIFVSRDSRG